MADVNVRFLSLHDSRQDPGREIVSQRERRFQLSLPLEDSLIRSGSAAMQGSIGAINIDRTVVGRVSLSLDRG